MVTDRVVWLTYHRSISVATDHDQRPFGFRLRQHLAGPLRKPLGALDVPDDGVGVRYYPHEASASRRASSLPRSKSSQAKSANSGSEPARRSPLGATTASTTRRWAPGSSPSLRSWSAGCSHRRRRPVHVGCRHQVRSRLQHTTATATASDGRVLPTRCLFNVPPGDRQRPARRAFCRQFEPPSTSASPSIGRGPPFPRLERAWRNNGVSVLPRRANHPREMNVQKPGAS